MAQKREKDETLELKVPADAPPLSLSCPDNCKISSNCPGPEPTRIDPGSSVKAGPPFGKSRSVKRRLEQEQGQPEEEAAADMTGQPGHAAAKKAVNRCSGCGKRVGLTGFRCRCGDLFCFQHRYSDRHDCSYDYKAAGREAIARENPVVKAAKILKV